MALRGGGRHWVMVTKLTSRLQRCRFNQQTSTKTCKLPLRERKKIVGWTMLNPPATDLKWQVLVCFCPVSYEVTCSNGHQLWGWSDQRIGGKIYGWKHGEHFPKNGWGFHWNVFSNSGDLHIYRLMVASTQNQRSSRVESNRLFKHTVGVNNTSV